MVIKICCLLLLYYLMILMWGNESFRDKENYTNFFFILGVSTGSAQDLLLDLCPMIFPGGIWGPNRVPGIYLGSVVLSGPQNLYR